MGIFFWRSKEIEDPTDAPRNKEGKLMLGPYRTAPELPPPMNRAEQLREKAKEALERQRREHEKWRAARNQKLDQLLPDLLNVLDEMAGRGDTRWTIFSCGGEDIKPFCDKLEICPVDKGTLLSDEDLTYLGTLLEKEGFDIRSPSSTRSYLEIRWW